MKCSCFFVCFAYFIESASASLIPRIIGGDNADISIFPYQASLRVRGSHLCGCCIISNRHILTAAHCITHNDHGVVFPSPDVTVSTGTGSIRQTGKSHSIAKVAIHPGWRGTPGTSNVNDVAVITLAGKIKFDNNQQKIELASHDIVSRSVGILTGWGRTAPNGLLSPQLQRLSMRIINSKDCQIYHPHLKLFKEQLCAFQRAGHGSCYGDSGGPLVIGNEVVGVLSWVSEGCFGDGTAELFTNVYAQRGFITSAMK